MPHAIALIGGTGDEGRGLALRLAAAGHAVTIGSRDATRASAAAAAVAALLPPGTTVAGATNEDAAAEADIVIVTVPFEAHRATLEGLAPALAGKVVVDAVVPMRFERGPRPIDVEEGSATEQAAALLPASEVIGAFHNVAASSLLDLTVALDQDWPLIHESAEHLSEGVATAVPA